MFKTHASKSDVSLIKFDTVTSLWSEVLVFGEVPFSDLSGMLASDATGTKWWLAAGESGKIGQDTLLYAEGAGANATRKLMTAIPMSTMEYVAAADEFLGTWQKPGGDLFFGALDPYLAKQNTMIDLTANDSIPWSTFGSSALDPRTLAFTFVVGVESRAGGKFSLARVSPNGHGIDVQLGKPCADGCTLQSVEHLRGIDAPVALTMSPGAHNATPGALYTYSWVAWDVSAGAPAAGSKVLGSWASVRYNTFSDTAAGGGALFASDAFSSPHVIMKVDVASGALSQVPSPLGAGALFDLAYVE